MSDPARGRMRSDVFIAWAMEQPGGSRFELVAREIVAMAPGGADHSRLKRAHLRATGRGEDGATMARIVRGGPLPLDPPGLELQALATL